MGDVLACANLGYCYETGQGRRRSMNHQTVRNTGLRFIAGLIAAVMLATTCPAGQPVTDTCSYAYAAESPAKNAAEAPAKNAAEAPAKNAAESPVKNAAEAPSKITGLKLEVTSRPSTTLTWNKSDCDGYKVYRGSKAIARVTAGELDDLVTFTDEELEPGASCTYLVRPYKIVNGDEVYGPYSPALKIVEGYTYASADTAGTSASAAAIKLTGYTGRDKKLTVPSELDGRKVTEIGEGCFSGNVWVERAYVPEGVVKIGDYAFECCGLLEKVYLPDSLTAIGNGAFSGCGKLMYADISDETASIGNGAFMACEELKQINLPRHLKTLGKFAFALCQKLSIVTFRGSELEAIPERAFNECPELQALTLPKGIRTIEKRAFLRCKKLSKISMDGDSSVTEIREFAFEGTKINNISGIITSDASIGFGVFGKNEADFYDKYDSLDEKGQIALPASVTLAEGAFYGAMINGIQLIDVENANYKVVNGSLYSKDGKTLVVYFPTEGKRVGRFTPTEEAGQKIFHVPEGVTRIAPYAFFECGLEQIYLPPSVTEISDHAFTKSGIAPV